MRNPKIQRERRKFKIRSKISMSKCVRLSVHTTNLHVYAQLIESDSSRVITSASSLETQVKKELKYGGNISAAIFVGKRIAEKAKGFNVVEVAFDRSGNKYHGRIKALANAARENGLKF